MTLKYSVLPSLVFFLEKLTQLQMQDLSVKKIICRCFVYCTQLSPEMLNKSIGFFF